MSSWGGCDFLSCVAYVFSIKRLLMCARLIFCCGMPVVAVTPWYDDGASNLVWLYAGLRLCLNVILLLRLWTSLLPVRRLWKYVVVFG